MRLYLMRHCDAVDSPGDDFSRVLSGKGRRQAEKMGGWLAALLREHAAANPKDGARGPLVLSSPYPRARETAAIVAAGLPDAAAPRVDDRLASGMTPERGTAVIHELGGPGGLLLVGHAPDLGLLTAHLLGARESGMEMRKGAVACLEAGRAGFGGSVLRWLINPELLPA